ncbi:MAG: radical SAM protein [bacterium]
MENFTPSYLKLDRKELESRVKALNDLPSPCTLCPRMCSSDRRSGDKGYCRTAFSPEISSASPHFGEESPLVGHGGSGTIFFTNCNLCCNFCQNYDISQQGIGEIISVEDLARLMILLQKRGCHNINFVTPTHQVHAIVAALPLAVDAGLNVPLVYNTGGYDSVQTLKLLEGIIDIYMPDLKFTDPDVALSLADAPDYPSVVKTAVIEMYRQTGDLLASSEGIARRGLLVRHLVLPHDLAGSEEAFRFLAEEISPNTYLNVMAQYRPCFRASGKSKIGDRLKTSEYNEALSMAKRAGLSRLDERHPGRIIF